MGTIKSISIYGGQEIVQCKYPKLLSKINDLMLNNSNNTTHYATEDFINSKIVEYKFIRIHDNHLWFENDFLYPEMQNMSAYICDEILLYYPQKQSSDFWFDLISLSYLYSNGYIKACIIIFTIEFLRTCKLKCQQLINLLMDPSINICEFPSFIIYEES